MAYRLVQLAPGAYDVEWNGEPIAALVSVSETRWWVESWDTRKQLPSPFSRAKHEFASFLDACEWLGNPPIAELRSYVS